MSKEILQETRKWIKKNSPEELFSDLKRIRRQLENLHNDLTVKTFEEGKEIVTLLSKKLSEIQKEKPLAINNKIITLGIFCISKNLEIFSFVEEEVFEQSFPIALYLLKEKDNNICTAEMIKEGLHYFKTIIEIFDKRNINEEDKIFLLLSKKVTKVIHFLLQILVRIETGEIDEKEEIEGQYSQKSEIHDVLFGFVEYFFDQFSEVAKEFILRSIKEEKPIAKIVACFLIGILGSGVDDTDVKILNFIESSIPFLKNFPKSKGKLKYVKIKALTRIQKSHPEMLEENLEDIIMSGIEELGDINFKIVEVSTVLLLLIYREMELMQIPVSATRTKIIVEKLIKIIKRKDFYCSPKILSTNIGELLFTIIETRTLKQSILIDLYNCIEKELSILLEKKKEEVSVSFLCGYTLILGGLCGAFDKNLILERKDKIIKFLICFLKFENKGLIEEVCMAFEPLIENIQIHFEKYAKLVVSELKKITEKDENYINFTILVYTNFTFNLSANCFPLFHEIIDHLFQTLEKIEELEIKTKIIGCLSDFAAAMKMEFQNHIPRTSRFLEQIAHFKNKKELMKESSDLLTSYSGFVQSTKENPQFCKTLVKPVFEMIQVLSNGVGENDTFVLKSILIFADFSEAMGSEFKDILDYDLLLMLTKTYKGEKIDSHYTWAIKTLKKIGIKI